MQGLEHALRAPPHSGRIGLFAWGAATVQFTHVFVAAPKIFIGHGRSDVWHDLRDFITNALDLPYDEFNAVSAAGMPTVRRLSQMLDDASFAFLVLTGEDELADHTMQARMNVVHEAGLFQGRLGFERAIILLEEGREEFSNIEGLVQIRFPAKNISTKFDEIRQVLQRERII
jgi:predicted nucleotide-binding protein